MLKPPNIMRNKNMDLENSFWMPCAKHPTPSIGNQKHGLFMSSPFEDIACNPFHTVCCIGNWLIVFKSWLLCTRAGAPAIGRIEYDTYSR